LARKPRFDIPYLLYHVTARGNNRELIFWEKNDYLAFIKYLTQAKEKYRFSLYAFCLMPNHTHLLLKTTENGSLSRIMQTLHTAYTMYVNRKYTRCGHLFQGRYKSVLVEEEPHLLELLRYIHQNPVRAGLVKEVTDYPYSSYPLYLKDDISGSDDNLLIEREEIFSYFGKRPITQQKRFQAFVEKKKKRSAYQPKQLIRNRIFLGSAEFENRVINTLVNEDSEV